MSVSIFQHNERSRLIHHHDGSFSSILLNVGTVIPVNPLSSGEMLLANVSYQTRNAIMALKQQVISSHEVMNEMMYQIREQHSFNLKMNETVRWLCDVVEESQFGSATSNNWCDFGSQALNTVSSLCYGIPMVGTFFAGLFKNASVLVDWYGDSISKSNCLDAFDIRRTAYFDNIPNFSSTSDLGLSLSRMDDELDKMHALDRKLVDIDACFYESEKWLSMNNHVDNGLNFFGLLDVEGKINRDFMGVAFPVITLGEKSIYWATIDAKSKTCSVGSSSAGNINVRNSVKGSIAHNMIGNNKSGYKVVKCSMTPMFTPDDEMVSRIYDLKKLSCYLSDDRDRCMGQIHGFLQLGGKVGEAS